MLTQNDLIAIGRIIDNKFDSRLTGIEKRLSSMEIKIGILETRMGFFEVKMGSFEKKLGLLETKLTKKVVSLDRKIDRLDRGMNRKLDVVINYFEHRDIDLGKRVDRIETHLSLAPLNS